MINQGLPGSVEIAILASGDTTGATDTAAIQAALNLIRTSGVPGRVKGIPGATYTVRRLMVGSHSTLDFRDSTVNQAAGYTIAGVGTNIVTNYSDANPVATASDATVTSGSNVVTTSLAQQAQVGQTLYVSGAGANGYGELIGNISAVNTGSNQITLVKLYGDGLIAANASATVSGAAVQLSNRDTHIKLLFGTVNRGANGPSNAIAGTRGECVGGHSLFLRGVDHYEVDIDSALSTAGISFVWPTNATNGRVRVGGANCVRTICQPVGPIFNLKLEIHGQCNDDEVNLCGNVYPYQTNTCGDVIGVTIKDIEQVGTSTATALKINPGQGNLVDDVRVLGRIQCEGASSGQSLVQLMSDPAYPATTGGNLGHIDLGLIYVPAGADINYALNCNVVTAESVKAVIEPNTQGALLLEAGFTAEKVDVKIVTSSVAGADPLINMGVSPAPSIGELEVDFAVNCTAYIQQLIYLALGTIGTLKIKGAESFSSAANSQYVVRFNGTATVNTVLFEGGLTNLGDSLCRIDAATAVGRVVLAGHTHTGGQRWLNTAVATNLYLESPQRVSCTQAPLFCQSAGVAVNVYGTGLATTDTLVGGSNNTAVAVYDPTIPCGITHIPATANAMCWNTDTGQKCGLGPVICDGTSWRPLVGYVATGTAVLVAGTKAVTNANITSAARVRVYVQTPGGTVGAPYVSSVTAGTGFTISSTSASDTSTVQYEIESY